MREIRLEDALLELMNAERSLSWLETSEAFQAFTEKQKKRYRQVLAELCSLVEDISKDTSPE